MKKLKFIFLFVCIIAISCAESPSTDIEAVSAPAMTQKYIGRFAEDVSLTKSFGDKILVEKELDEGFDVFSIDINAAKLKYEYTINQEDKLLYSKQINADQAFKVKQLGNSEENNVLVLEGKSAREIAKRVAFSGYALVTVSPSSRYVVYCTVEDIMNQYSLYLYDLETGKNILLTNNVSEDLLNDLEGSISWSRHENYLAVSNDMIFDIPNGKLISEINADNISWSDSGKKLAYTIAEDGYGRFLCVLDLDSGNIDEVFIANKDEYLPGNIIWNQNETKLAFGAATIKGSEMKGDISPYSAIYSLDLTTKEAVRIDTMLKLDSSTLAKLQSIHYNASGSIIAFTVANSSGCDLYIYNIDTEDFSFFSNVEYLHYEDNESYVCSFDNKLYFVQDRNLIELDENMNSRIVHESSEGIEDIYISSEGSSMIIAENYKGALVLRQLENFAKRNM